MGATTSHPTSRDAKKLPTYSYRPLDRRRKEIRLLTLQPGADPDDIRATLSHAFLVELPFPHYETVSYACGNPNRKRNIILDGDWTRVLENSELVLRRMRLPASERVLWIDAVCIDQHNLSERGHQVGIMSEIYAKTSNNSIWLGPDDGHTAQAIVSMNDVLDEMTTECRGLENLDKVLYDSDGGLNWSRTSLAAIDHTETDDTPSLVHFFRSPWFKRLWIVQEASLAPDSVCYRGRYEIQLLDILRVASWIRYKRLRLSRSFTSEFIPAGAIFDSADKMHGRFWNPHR